jgi:hypothetical protein
MHFRVMPNISTISTYSLFYCLLTDAHLDVQAVLLMFKTPGAQFLLHHGNFLIPYPQYKSPDIEQAFLAVAL